MIKRLDDIYNYIMHYNMIEPSDRIVIGVSGGADSVCLLLVLCSLAKKLETCAGNLFVVHVNHMIRGSEADNDEEFVRSLCEKLGVNFTVFHEDVPVFARSNGLTIEEAGRIIRYECFDRVAKEKQCGKIAVAHNKNDLAETVIFNILRGSGLNGIAGIKPVRDMVIRPLLNTTRGEIEEYLLEAEQEYIIDSTNACTDYDRNRIRHLILPELQGINSSALEHICNVATEAGESYSFIHTKAMESLDEVMINNSCGRIELDIEKLLELQPVIQEHVIYEAISEACGSKKDITRRHVLAAGGLVNRQTGKIVELPYGLTARRSYDKLIIGRSDAPDEAYSIDISGDGVYKIPNWGNLHIENVMRTPKDIISKKIYTKMADYGKIKGGLCIRTPLDGDYIVIDDVGNKKKLSRVFIDCKIDRERRLSWPVLACGNEILWVLGLRFSEAYKIDDNTTEIMYLVCEGKGE